MHADRIRTAEEAVRASLLDWPIPYWLKHAPKGSVSQTNCEIFQIFGQEDGRFRGTAIVYFNPQGEASAQVRWYIGAPAV